MGKRKTKLDRMRERNAKLRAEPQRENRSGLWGREKGWRSVTREKLDELCSEHPRRTCTRMFHGRQIRYVYDARCKVRAIIRRGRRGGPTMTSIPEVVLQ